MNINTITAVIAIIAGFFGGFIGNMIVSFYTKNLDFKYDYKKYILDKRKTAYDEVGKILADLSITQTNKELSIFRAIFIDRFWFQGTKTRIDNAILNYRVWLNNEILESLTAISRVMDNIDLGYGLRRVAWDEKFAAYTAETFENKFEIETEKLYKIFFKDIRKLDNIKEFKNIKLTN